MNTTQKVIKGKLGVLRRSIRVGPSCRRLSTSGSAIRNEGCGHQGRWCSRRTSMRTVSDTMPLAKEKV